MSVSMYYNPLSTPVPLTTYPISLSSLTVAVRLMPPLSFFLKPMLGGLLFKRMPKPSSSFSIIFLCPKGFRTSRTIKIKLHVLATEEMKIKKSFPKIIKDNIIQTLQNREGVVDSSYTWDRFFFKYTYISIYLSIYIERDREREASQVTLEVKNFAANAGDIRDTSSIPG